MNDAFDGRALRGEPLRCPVDGSRLVQVERTEILVDACPECRGIWLDRGELDRILVKERQLQHGDDDFFSEVEGKRRAPAPPAREPERAREHDEGYRKKKKRRSLLEELLDFD